MNEERWATGKTREVAVRRYWMREASDGPDMVCVEEPLEIMINDEPYYMTMRLPGQDMFLAIGLCFSEGVISSLGDVQSVNHCIDSTNRVNVYLTPEHRMRMEPAKKRRTIAYASCGLCGKELISDIRTVVTRSDRTLTTDLSQVFVMQHALESEQPVFEATGGTHLAGLFDGRGRLLASSEDVGRHNALDKAIGHVLFQGKGGEAKILILSSRLSYEMVQKAACLGVEIIAGASAPTSLAVDLARELDITLIGFLRPARANIYTAPERITMG
jgi:FdhD protein